MRIGSITTTLGNRPGLLFRNRQYMAHQSLPLDESIVVDYPQKTFPHDLTERIKYGLDQLKDKCDLIFFTEDDDYYPRQYIEIMVEEWEKAGKPELFGIGETFFYHPEFKGVWYRKHVKEGPCTFQLCITSSAIDKIDWSLTNDLFIDAGLWRQLEGKTVLFGKPLALGIKHGRGKCGAGGHVKQFYENRITKCGTDTTKDEWAAFDKDGRWLWQMIGPDAEWYENFGRVKDLV